MIYDTHNVREFVKAGDRGKYICCNCGQPTTYEDSISHQGYHLICTRCMYKLQHLLGSHDIMLQIQKAGECESRHLEVKFKDVLDKAASQCVIYTDTDSFLPEGGLNNAEKNKTICADTDSVHTR